MASSFITYALQINFDSVLEIIDNVEMVSMFKTLESTGLKGFLGCPSVLYERELEQFFDTAMVKDGDITCEVSGKFVVISEDRFAGVFGLPTEGLVNLSEVPKDLVYDARSIFSQSGEPISTYGKKHLMKYEYHLLNDILAKSVTVKAGSFDAVTHERFLMMTAIHFGIQGDPTVTMGEATNFPPLKILSAKTVKSYIATNETIDARGKADEPSVAKIARSKKRPIATGDEPAVTKKKRTAKRKASSSKDNMDIVSVAKEAIPLQTFEPSTGVPAEQSPVPKRKSKKRRLRLQKSPDDEHVEKRASVEEVLGNKVLVETAQMEEIETTEREQPLETDVGEETVVEGQAVVKADEVENWFNLSYEEFFAQQDDRLVESASETDGEQEIVSYETGVGEQQLQTFDETENRIDASTDYFVTEPVAGMELADVIPTVGEKTSTDEAMTLEEILLTIPDGDWYKASLPKIPAADKGKAPLLERDPIKGISTKESLSLIIANINLLVQLREKVIDEVDRFFNSFSFKKLAHMKIEEIYAKEELVLSCAEADSTRVALHRKMNILTKYMELLIWKFLEVLKSNFVPSEGSSTTDLKILDWLSDFHLFVLEELKEQILAHGLTWDNTCCSKIFEGRQRDHDVIIALSNPNFKSLCWHRTMATVDGSLVIQEGNDLWMPIPVAPSNFEVSRQLSYVDTLPPVSEFFKMMRKRWADVCIEAVGFLVSGKLLPVGSLNFCRALTAVQPVSEFGYRRPTVTSWGWSQLCTAFFRYSLFSGLLTVDFSIFGSDTVLIRTSLGSANIFDTGVQLPQISFSPASVFASDEQLITSSDAANQDVKMDIDRHGDTPVSSADSSFHFSSDDIPLEDDTVHNQISLPVVSTDLIEAFAQLRASDRAYRAFLNNIREDIHDQKTLLSLDVLTSQQKLSTQVTDVAFDNADIRKEVKERRAMLTDLDGQGEGGSSSRPQPPPDDQSRSSGGNGSRANDQSRLGRGSVSREDGNRGSGSDRRRDDRSGSKRRRSDSGGGESGVESGIHGITYGPYLPPKRGAKWLLFGEKLF
ncbi:hypothetical protein F511_13001 [Dorcoceras hygrometricum]|uniref:Dystroglycan-like n=1 Tax=Dorcoceras hygrometricum TaxID=472368 RepID=A0A2Z7BEN8_9LAMI|nr:hypothetical protein F511_13001 [Dorcoceras hygrometricum]